MHIRLETKDGGLVGHFDIPNFNMPPKAVTWGSRIFAFHRWEGDNIAALGEKAKERQALYREVFAYSIASQIMRELTEKDLVEGATPMEDDGT